MLRSTISDAEVDAIQYDTPGTYGTPPHTLDVGWMYTIDYALSGDDTRTLPVATTRPETMFADVALAVNPGDARYVHLIGQHVRHPLASHRILPIVADTAVHSDKGTGVLKVCASN
jgi:valyl-tRNA synthetase